MALRESRFSPCLQVKLSEISPRHPPPRAERIGWDETSKKLEEGEGNRDAGEELGAFMASEGLLSGKICGDTMAKRSAMLGTASQRISQHLG